MKKLTALAAILISTTASASDYYITSAIGINAPLPSHTSVGGGTGRSKSDKLSPSLHFGVGKDFDILRTDFTLSYFFGHSFSHNGITSDKESYTLSSRRKHAIAMLKVYEDFKITDSLGAFVGVGAGIDMYRDRRDGNLLIEGVQYDIGDLKHAKNGSSFVYALTTGTSINLCSGAKLDLSYNFLHMTKRKVVNPKLHNITAGLRIAL